MRFFEFQLPKPTSSFAPELAQYFVKLIKSARSLPENDPKRIEFNQFLEKIKQEAGIREDAIADVNQEVVNAILSAAAKKGNNQALLMLLNGAEILGDVGVQQALQKSAEIQKQAGVEQEFTAGKTIRERLETAATELSKKISGTLGAMEEAAKAELISDPSAPKKKAPKPEEVKRDLVDLITDLFSKPISGAKTVQERDQLAEKILDFMKRCETGVINLVSMVQAGGGNVLDSVSDDDKRILDILENALLKAKPSKTAGNWGPGELGLAILGTPVHKAGKGDLQIGDFKIELKASQDARSGGRFGSKALNYGINGKARYEAALKTLMLKAGYSDRKFSFNSSSPLYIGKYRTPDIQRPRSVKPGKDKAISHYNFGETFINSSLNTKLQGRVDRQDTQNFLLEVAKSCIVDSYQKQLKLNWVRKAANSDGTINYSEFLKGYSAMLFDLYRQTDDVEQIMVLNPITGSFRILDEPKDMYSATEPQEGANHIQFGTTAIDFNDSQGKASPQIGIA
jgi:hypothetical protein